MNAFRIIAIVAVLTFLAGTRPSSAQHADAPGSNQIYTIHRVYKADDVDQYLLTITKRINGAQTNGKDYDLKMVLTMKETVKSTGDSGQVSLAEEFVKADGTFDGVSGNIMDQVPRLTINKNRAGQMDVTTEGGQEPMSQQIASLAKALMQIQDAVLPKTPVKIGDTWMANVAKLSPDDEMTTRVTVKFEGVEVIDGVKTFKLKTSTETSGGLKGDTKVHGEGAFNVDSTTGELIKMTSKSTGTERAAKISSTIIYEKGASAGPKPTSKDTAPQ